MGRRGPPPTPTVLRILRGNPGKRPINTDEPQLEKLDCPVPRGMKGAARKEWLRLYGPLTELGLLTVGDYTLFEQYCRIFGDVDEYEKLVRRVGAGEAHRLGYANFLNKLRAQLRQFALALGLSPTSRGSVKASKPVGTNAAQAKRDRFFGNRGTGSA